MRFLVAVVGWFYLFGLCFFFLAAVRFFRNRQKKERERVNLEFLWLFFGILEVRADTLSLSLGVLLTFFFFFWLVSFFFVVVVAVFIPRFAIWLPMCHGFVRG